MSGIGEEFYQEEIPPYIKGVGKTFIVVNAESGFGEEASPRKITISDVLEYYRTQAPNISSGIHSLAGIHGDWRQIDSMAKEMLELFKCINIDGLRKASRKAGLTPRF